MTSGRRAPGQVGRTFERSFPARGAITLLLCALHGCSPSRQPELADSAAGAVVVAQGDRVVARVDGVPITGRRVEALARLTKRPPGEVLQRLVEMELLAQEARRRGFESSAEVRENVVKAMVQRYLEREFDATHRPEDMPESMLRAAYEKNIGVFVHPRLRKVAHIIVDAPDGQATKAEQRTAFALAGKIRAEAVLTKSLEEFGALAGRFDGTQGFKVRLEVLDRTIPGGSYVGSFVNAAMLLEKVGDVSEPVETMYGSHVIYLVEVIESIDQSFEEVREEVVQHEYPFWCKAQFYTMLEDLRLSSKVTGYEGQLRRGEHLGGQ
jgi:hypothetical protein